MRGDSFLIQSLMFAIFRWATPGCLTTYAIKILQRLSIPHYESLRMVGCHVLQPAHDTHPYLDFLTGQLAPAGRYFSAFAFVLSRQQAIKTLQSRPRNTHLPLLIKLSNAAMSHPLHRVVMSKAACHILCIESSCPTTQACI